MKGVMSKEMARTSETKTGIEIRRYFTGLSPQQEEELVDLVAELVVSYLKRKEITSPQSSHCQITAKSTGTQ